MKKVLMLVSVVSMIDNFNMPNIKLLQEMGFEVEVACSFDDGAISNEKIEKIKGNLTSLGIKYHYIDFSRNVLKINKIIKAYKQVKKLINEREYAFIHCHAPIGGAVGRLATRKSRTKCVYTAHGFHFFKGAPMVNWMIYYNVEKYCSRFTDVLLTINQEDFSRATKKFKAKKTEYIPGIGIDTEQFFKREKTKEEKRRELEIPENAVLLLSIGELNKNKNHKVIIKAMAEINDPNMYYCIAGRGNLDEHLNALAEKLGVAQHVKLLGYRTDVKELYTSADIFCFPSFREGLSVSLMEAMANRLPCVVSGIRGNVDLIKDEELICSPSDYGQFRTAIMRLIENNQFCDKAGQENQENVKVFDIENVMIKMREIYEEAGKS